MVPTKCLRGQSMTQGHAMGPADIGHQPSPELNLKGLPHYQPHPEPQPPPPPPQREEEMPLIHHHPRPTTNQVNNLIIPIKKIKILECALLKILKS